jgi:hypothetical protein
MVAGLGRIKTFGALNGNFLKLSKLSNEFLFLCLFSSFFLGKSLGGVL